MARAQVYMLLSLLVLHTQGLDPEIASKLDEFAGTVLGCREMVGLNLAIVQGGQMLYTQGYGKSDLDTGLQVDQDTQFGIASLSKAFAATLLAKLLAKHER